MSRTRYLVAYDIAESKRLYHVHKLTSAYAVSGQKSFYECWLTALEFAEFQQKITACIEPLEDKVFIFRLEKNSQPMLFGCAKLPAFNQPFFVI